jgi:PadR family transcriptional regulator AphA
MNAAKLSPGAHAVLGLLSREPTSGYELGSLAERTIAHFWPITRAHIYAELGRLEDAGADFGDERRRNPLLLKVFFGDRMSPERLAGLLAAQRARCEANRARYAAVVAELEDDPTAVMRRATALYGVRCAESQLAWLDEVEPLIAPAAQGA